jgi:hypothetical protein
MRKFRVDRLIKFLLIMLGIFVVTYGFYFIGQHFDIWHIVAIEEVSISENQFYTSPELLRNTTIINFWLTGFASILTVFGAIATFGGVCTLFYHLYDWLFSKEV